MIEMVLLTRVSSGGTTVVPAALRREAHLECGDRLEWEFNEGVFTVRPRKRMTLDDITGIGSHGGNSVEDKYRMYDEQW